MATKEESESSSNEITDDGNCNQTERTENATEPQKCIRVHFSKVVKRKTVENGRNKDEENFLRELLKVCKSEQKRKRQQSASYFYPFVMALTIILLLFYIFHSYRVHSKCQFYGGPHCQH